MLGAGMRMVAVLGSYFHGEAKRFVFSTGITEKNKSQFGDDIPTEAQTYQKKFLRSIEGMKKRKHDDELNGLEEPEIILEDKSFSTMTNIKELLQMIVDNNWRSIKIISSDYHIPRVQALYEQALAQHPEIDVAIEFVSAEEYVKRMYPGKYDKVIDSAYRSEEALKRIENEKKGLEDIKNGTYAVEEFQLVQRQRDEDN